MFELRDPVASGTHLFTSLWAIFATLILRRLTRHDRSRQWAVTVFGLSMVVLYAASGLYHGLNLPREKLRLYQKLDQSAIYTLIAGTCTPIMAILLRNPLRIILLTSVWVIAGLGVAALWLLPQLPHAAMVAFYLGLGWVGFSGGLQYYRAVGMRGLSWAIGGAACYTFGAVCELTRWPVIWPGWINFHEVLHVADMAGTFCFFIFVVRFVIPYQPSATERTEAEQSLSAAPSAPRLVES